MKLCRNLFDFETLNLDKFNSLETQVRALVNKTESSLETLV